MCVSESLLWSLKLCNGYSLVWKHIGFNIIYIAWQVRCCYISLPLLPIAHAAAGESESVCLLDLLPPLHYSYSCLSSCFGTFPIYLLLCPVWVLLFLMLVVRSLRSGQQQVAPRIEVASQLGVVVVLQRPLLPGHRRVAVLHLQLVFAIVDGQALAGGAVVQLLCVLAVRPELKRKRKWIKDTFIHASKMESEFQSHCLFNHINLQKLVIVLQHRRIDNENVCDCAGCFVQATFRHTHLISFAAVAGVERHFLAGIIEAGVVSAYFSRLAQHPVLQEIGRGWGKTHININCNGGGCVCQLPKVLPGLQSHTTYYTLMFYSIKCWKSSSSVLRVCKSMYVSGWCVCVCRFSGVCVYVSVSGFCLKLGGLAMIIYNLKHVANARWHEFSLSLKLPLFAVARGHNHALLSCRPAALPFLSPSRDQPPFCVTISVSAPPATG